MRVTPLVPLLLTALTTCAAHPSPPPETRELDRTIDLILVLEKGKCVVRFADLKFKDERYAIAYTAHAVIWRVKSNACGEKTKDKGDKALGLKHLRLKGGTESAKWFNERCQPLNVVPAVIETPPAFRCDIPSSSTGEWEGIYEYEINGDSIEPVDPGLDVRKNG